MYVKRVLCTYLLVQESGSFLTFRVGSKNPIFSKNRIFKDLKKCMLKEFCVPTY